MSLKDDRTRKLILIGLGTVVICAFHFGTKLLPFTYRARAEEIGKLEDRHEELSGKLLRARRTVARLPELDAQLERLEARWATAQELLPEETEIAALLREVTFRGQACGVEFTLFKPLAPVPREHVTERPVEIKVVGGYHQIARFLNEIARMDRIVHVRELELEALPRGTDEVGTIQARFLAVPYVLGGMAEQEAARAPAGSGGVVDRVRRVVSGRQEAAAVGRGTQGGTEE